MRRKTGWKSKPLFYVMHFVATISPGGRDSSACWVERRTETLLFWLLQASALEVCSKRDKRDHQRSEVHLVDHSRRDGTFARSALAPVSLHIVQSLRTSDAEAGLDQRRGSYMYKSGCNLSLFFGDALFYLFSSLISFYTSAIFRDKGLS